MENHDEFGVEHRLATYGTLAPGRSNEHVLDDVRGSWSQGTIRGHLEERGWGATSGYPGIILDEDGPEVTVHIFTSQDLPDHWERLDAFEGAEYLRTAVTVLTDGGEVAACVYALA